jgi:hypothetical protein
MTRRPTRAGEIVIAGILLAALAGCRTRKGIPPLDHYEMTLEVPPAPGKPAPAVPDTVLGPARVWINQETPRQKKTPVWQPFPAKDGTLLDLSPDGKWRCLLNPVHVLGSVEESATVERWTTSRTLRCTSDNWSTFVEGLVTGVYAQDGKRVEGVPRAVLYLKDVVGGQPRSTVVVLDGEIPKPPPGR